MAAVVRLLNPATGAIFEFRGQWLRNRPATDQDVRMGLAKFRGDKVYLPLPPGVQAQVRPGRPPRWPVGWRRPACSSCSLSSRAAGTGSGTRCGTVWPNWPCGPFDRHLRSGYAGTLLPWLSLPTLKPGGPRWKPA